MTTAIDTRKSPRRSVTLDTLADLFAEIDRIQIAAAEERVRTTGNWTVGQIFTHLGRWVEYSIDGFPFQYPRPMRLMAKAFAFFSWKGFYRLILKPGYTNPESAAQAVEPEPAMSLDAGADYLRRQLRRIEQGERMHQRSPGGPALKHDQWLWVHLRHCEMHLSFVHIDEAAA